MGFHEATGTLNRQFGANPKSLTANGRPHTLLQDDRNWEVMGDGLEPTETYDGTITVSLLDDTAGTTEIQCSSYAEAVEKVKDHAQSVTAVKIIDRDDDVVFSSMEMDIDDWAVQWDHAKRRLGVDVEEYDCPYDNISCFADDLCVRCKMDKVQNQF